jgi:RNase P subunit RPR2
MIIAARRVQHSQKQRFCEVCNNPIPGQHVAAFGCAERYDKPYWVRLCAGCANNSKDVTNRLNQGDKP